ncbi:uncharacterized protein [Centruroides vittatus]|uniref:uncharacterized protein n=1 Tax=Centruroides vittatus TaxID=120091 RepID=UPI00350FFCF4
MKLVLLLMFLAIVLPSFCKPVEEEATEIESKKTDDQKVDAVEDDDDAFDKDDIPDHTVVEKRVVVNQRPFNLHIDIPPFFDLKLLTGRDGHSLGIGVFPGFKPVTIIKEKEKN